MEPRKLIKLGNSSYAIALPKDWVDKSGLKKGDSVYILPNSNGELIIAPRYHENNRNKVKKIDLVNLDKTSAVHELRSAYVQDNDILEIKGITKENKDTVKKVLQEMIGFEIIESHEGQMVLKDFFNIQEAQLENFLRKIDNSIRSMFEDMTSNLQKNPLKEKDVSEMYETDTEINKFYILITRIFFRSMDNPSILNTLKVNSKNLFDYWWIAFHLEHIADEIKRLTKIMKTSEIKKNKVSLVFEACSSVKENYAECLNSYYKHGVTSAKASLNMTRALWENLVTSAQAENGVLREIIMKLSSINRSIYEVDKILVYGLA